MNRTLSICIPTYNRATKLRECVEHLIPQLREHEIPIFISDNASTDTTEAVVSELKTRYDLIFYSRNATNLGADCNFELVLKSSASKYAWLLGDDDKIAAGSIDGVLAKLQDADFDMVVVNGGEMRTQDGYVEGRVTDLADCVIVDKNELLSELAWHMTWLSCLIFSKKVIDNGNFKKFHDSCLMQVAVIFDCLACDSISICWISEGCVYATPASGPPAWAHRSFEIWAKNWFDVINNLPAQYSSTAKQKCILSHGVNSGIFSLRGIYELRKYGHYSLQHYREYKKYFKYVTNVNLAALYVIAMFPVGLLTYIREARKKCSKASPSSLSRVS
jgi:abequosyltransferase